MAKFVPHTTPRTLEGIRLRALADDMMSRSMQSIFNREPARTDWILFRAPNNQWGLYQWDASLQGYWFTSPEIAEHCRDWKVARVRARPYWLTPRWLWRWRRGLPWR